jgi:excinuclease ABC subunit A
VGVLYILDEPSIGLHQRDNVKLIESLKRLRDLGNTVIVVEHDKEMIEAADFVIDVGPKAGIHGGRIVASGTPAEILKLDTITAQYMNGIRKIEIPETRRAGNGKNLILKGAIGNNLKNVTVDLPLGKFVCITGVSGSGKSTLIRDILLPVLMQRIYKSKDAPGKHKKINGIEHLDKVIDMDQSPIDRQL